MKKNDLQIVLCLLKRTVLCDIYGFTSDQCLSIKEYEFTLQENRVLYLETWLNTHRTIGYKKWDVSNHNLFFPISLIN